MQILEKHKEHFIVLFIALCLIKSEYFWSFIYNIFAK